MKHITYQIERIPDHLWRSVKAKAAQDGKTIREVLLGLLTIYAGEADTTEEQTTATEHTEDSMYRCPRCQADMLAWQKDDHNRNCQSVGEEREP